MLLKSRLKTVLGSKEIGIELGAVDLNNEYKPRKASDNLLYKVLAEHLETFIADRETLGSGLPPHVTTELRDFLECGIVQHGFLRCRCESCGFEKVVPFSCRRRGFCMSCGAKRMVETAEHLVENILPPAQYRQWVVTLPFALRYSVATNRKLMSRIHKIISSEILSYYKFSTDHLSEQDGVGGYISFTHYFGSALQLTPHFHILFADGLFVEEEEKVKFVKLEGFRDEDVSFVLGRISRRIIRYLRRLKYLDREGEMVNRPDLDPIFGDYSDLDEAAGASIGLKIAFGPRAGRRVRRIGKSFGYEGEAPVFKGHLVASLNGFNLHAARRVKKHQRGQLESLLSYMGRSALSAERLTLRSDGDLEYKMKRRFSDGSEKLVLSPTELIEKIIAIIPLPRAHLTRYGGVFAPAHRLRSKVIKNPCVKKGHVSSASPDGKILVKNTMWARHLARVFGVDIGTCPKCGADMRVMGAVVDPYEVKRYLSHIGVTTELPIILPPRHTQLEFSYEPVEPP